MPTPWQKALRWPLLFLIRLYQALLSPLLPGSCRHVPTCSQYTLEAIQEWGALRGTWLGLKRLSRCHPWGSHGYDPIPKKNSKPRNPA